MTALFADSNSVHLIVAGDFNCQNGSRFYPSFLNLASENNLVHSDSIRLSDAFTYCSDSGMNTSWLDHFLCSNSIDNYLCKMDVLYDYISSDHKPIVAVFSGLNAVNTCDNAEPSSSRKHFVYDWSSVTDDILCDYQSVLDNALCTINIPSASGEFTHFEIDRYYNSVINCVKTACAECIPKKHFNTSNSHTVPGWNDLVDDKHTVAREAYLAWVYCGKPRQGPEFLHMRKTRASFKLSLRYCKQHEESIRADALANSLASKDYNKFWNSIHKNSNEKAKKHVSCIDGVVGETNIASTWQKHFAELYNSVHDDGSQALFHEKQNSVLCNSDSDVNISIREVANALNKQKVGKAVGPDDIPMEALIYGGFRLCVHIALLFNMFIKCKFLPSKFMESVIVPLVKCKSHDLSDMSNYRAIAISTSISKLFESVIAHYIEHEEDADKYQYGFKAGHSTGLCTNVFKRTVDYFTTQGSHVFVCFIDFTKAFDKVNYWKLFCKLLDDCINVNIVSILAFWYSKQQVCVRWQNTYSDWFSIGNGTRQGGLLLPRLFARYIRELINDLVASGIGCNIGGEFFNVLAYADDMVLLAPSWFALQKLLHVFHLHIGTIDMICNTKNLDA